MKKSLLISYFFPPKLGGIENYLYNLCEKLPRDKIVVLADGEDGSIRIDKNFSYPVYRTKIFSWPIRPSWFPLLWRLGNIIKKEKIEILQFGHYSNLVTLGLFYSFFKRIPFIVYTHGIDTLIPQKDAFSNWLMTVNLRRAHWIVANSKFMKKELVKLGIPEEKIIIVYPSINPDKFLKQVDSLGIKRKYNLLGKRVIITVGRLVQRKGQDSVIRALPKVIEKIPEVRYLIVGDGPYLKELKALVEKLRLQEVVIFAGPIDNREEAKIPFYNASDLFIMSTRVIDKGKDVESFGIVYLEAGILGLPVIASHEGGAPEIILDGETGLLVDPRNREEVSEAIIKLLSDKFYGDKLAKRLKERVEGFFTWDKQVRKIIKILENG